MLSTKKEIYLGVEPFAGDDPVVWRVQQFRLVKTVRATTRQQGGMFKG